MRMKRLDSINGFSLDLSVDPVPNPALAKLGLESSLVSKSSSESLERDSGTGDSKKSSEEENAELERTEEASPSCETDRLIQRGEVAVGAGESR